MPWNDKKTHNACVIEVDDDANTFSIIGDYNEEFKEELKALIPSSEREWDGDDKAWIVQGKHMVTVRSLAERHYDEVEVYD